MKLDFIRQSSPNFIRNLCEMSDADGLTMTVYFAAIIHAMILSTAVYACDGCGCRGGPGYRGADGQCVGWRDLVKKCGSPLTSRCNAEGSNLFEVNNEKQKNKK